MSNSVVPVAALAQAKQLVRNKKTFKRTEDQAPAQDERQADQDPNSVHAVQVDKAVHHAASMSDTTMSGDFSFTGALASAAADSASLAAESAQDDGGSTSDDGDGAGGTILLVGAVGLVGLGVAVLAGGGGGNRNDPPTVSAATATLTVDEDKAGTGTVTATDPDGDTLAYAVSTAAKNGTATVGTDGKYTYTPNANFNGTDSFVVTVKDPDGLSATQTVNVTVTSVNDAPVFDKTTVTATTNEDTALTGTAAATDVDGGALTYTATAKNGTVTIGADGKYTYTPNLDYNGTDAIVVTAKDAGGLSATQTINVTIAAVNDGPRASADTKTTLTIAEDTSGSVVASFTDPEGNNPVTTPLVTKGLTNGGALGFADGKFTYTPTANFNGTDSFTYSVKDSVGAETLTTVNITVTAVNDAPTVANAVPDQIGAKAGLEQTPYTFTLPANTFADVDVGDKLTYTATGLPTGVTFDATTGVFSGASPTAGTYNVTVTAKDTGGLTVSDTFVIAIASKGVSLDVGNPLQALDQAVKFDAAAAATTYTDDLSVKTNVVIDNFTQDDKIVVSGTTGATASAKANTYNYGTLDNGKDLYITYSPGGDPQTIILLDDVLKPGSTISVFSYETALAAVREGLNVGADYNFMTFA